MSNFDCMDDCIHLKACRRLQKNGKVNEIPVTKILYC